ncbi:hypothetical protein [Dyadobacter soli]
MHTRRRFARAAISRFIRNTSGGRSGGAIFARIASGSIESGQPLVTLVQ